MKMPVDGIETMESEEIQDKLSESLIKSYDEDSSTGYILEVDLSIPNHIHDKLSDLPLAPEHMEITDEMISPHSRYLRNNRKHSEKFASKKLAPNLYSKERYVVHILLLKFYLEEGVILNKIHTAIKFNQEAWIAPYIAENTRKRQLAQDEFERDYYKLLNNSFFGKTMEQVRKRRDIKLVSNERQHQWQVSKPGFKRFVKFGKNLIGLEVKKTVVLLDKPIILGFCILELSKLWMFHMHYREIMPRYPQAKLLKMDTDSFLYDIRTGEKDFDLYNDISEDPEFYDLFDFSNLDPNHPLYSLENHAVLGKFKDEVRGCIIEEYVGLRSKMYSIKVYDQGMKGQPTHKHTAPGTKKSKAQTLTHDDYVRVLRQEDIINRFSTDIFVDKDLFIEQTTIRSFNHQLKTITQRRVALSAYDDKRYILEDGITTRAYGHFLN